MTADYTPPDLTLFGEEHVRRYQETGGAVGHEWNGVPCLLLWTTGARTGQRRVNPVIYGTDGERFVIVASQGGLPTHPGWYHNLVANPDAEIQVGPDRFAVCARTAEGEERARLWKLMAAQWPNYDEYTKRTSRVIPVVVLERSWMSTEVALLDPQRIRQLFDLSSAVYADRGGVFSDDPYPAFHRLRETGPVHPGVVGPLAGYHGEAVFQGLPFPELPHFSVFDYDTCAAVMRDTATFVSAQPPAPGAASANLSILTMDGARHRSYRLLVQPSFVPRKATWWVQRWIQSTVDALIDVIQDNGRADLNVEFCAAIPLLTICGSFGVRTEEALDIREAVVSGGPGIDTFARIVLPIVAARRRQPADDLISVLVRAEVTDEEGRRHVLDDAEVMGFAYLLLTAGSGTTWKQLGITLHALLTHPEWLDAVRRGDVPLSAAIEEALRWQPTDPMFSRHVAVDTALHGVDIPKGSVVHLCFGAANRDPSRWERPDEYDPSRPSQGNLGFGTGPHVCLGQHVARAEIVTGVSALLNRLPGLRLDPDATPPTIIGMYERGPSAVPVVWG